MEHLDLFPEIAWRRFVLYWLVVGAGILTGFILNRILNRKK